MTVRNIFNLTLQISLPVNVCYKAGTGWQIHTTMAPMLLCGTAAICITLAPSEYQPCKYNTDTKVSYCTDRASSTDFFFLSSKAALPANTVQKPGNALVPVKVCGSDIWGGQVGVRIDLQFDYISDVACFPEIRERSRIVFPSLCQLPFNTHLCRLQRWLCISTVVLLCVHFVLIMQWCLYERVGETRRIYSNTLRRRRGKVGFRPPPLRSPLIIYDVLLSDS